MNQIPSFLFSGINKNIKDLTNELDLLGGGRARISTLEYSCIIDDRISNNNNNNNNNNKNNSNQILWLLGKSIGLRNIKLPKNFPIAESMKYFNINNIQRYSTIESSNNSIHYDNSREISQWILDGFNATVICYGMNPIKTESLYGNDISNRNVVIKRRKGLVYEVLWNLFEKVQDKSTESTIIISLSIWALKGDTIIDLCAGSNSNSTDRNSDKEGDYRDQRDQRGWLEFVSIECPSYDIAIQIIDIARERARHSSSPHKDSEYCHLFLRILLHSSSKNDTQAYKGSISHLHIVDLIRLANPDENINKLVEDERIARREAALQLNSLCKVITEIRDISRAANENKPTFQTKITSARDSKLTLILAPLIQGNTKTWFFLYLKDGEENYSSALHALTSLEGIGDIQSPCHHVKDIPLSSLHLKHPNTVLPPQYEIRLNQNLQLKSPIKSPLRNKNSQNLNIIRADRPIISIKNNEYVVNGDEENENELDKSTTDIPLPPPLPPKEELKVTNLLSSTEFDHLMDEFNTLMAQVDHKTPIRPNTPIHPSYSKSNNVGVTDENEPVYPLKTSNFEPVTTSQSLNFITNGSFEDKKEFRSNFQKILQTNSNDNVQKKVKDTLEELQLSDSFTKFQKPRQSNEKLSLNKKNLESIEAKYNNNDNDNDNDNNENYENNYNEMSDGEESDWERNSAYRPWRQESNIRSKSQELTSSIDKSLEDIDLQTERNKRKEIQKTIEKFQLQQEKYQNLPTQLNSNELKNEKKSRDNKNNINSISRDTKVEDSFNRRSHSSGYHRYSENNFEEDEDKDIERDLLNHKNNHKNNYGDEDEDENTQNIFHYGDEFGDQDHQQYNNSNKFSNHNNNIHNNNINNNHKNHKNNNEFERFQKINEVPNELVVNLNDTSDEQEEPDKNQKKKTNQGKEDVGESDKEKNNYHKHYHDKDEYYFNDNNNNNNNNNNNINYNENFNEVDYENFNRNESNENYADNDEFDEEYNNHQNHQHIGINELKLINESLMSSLRLEREAREKLIQMNRSLEEELLEARTTAEVQEEGHKVEVIRLKSQVRKLLSEHSHEDILASFEEDLNRLTNENNILKQRNEYLENKKSNNYDQGYDTISIGTDMIREKTKEGDPGISWSTNEGMIGKNGETTVSIREYRTIRIQLKKLQKSYNEIVQKYETLRKNERHFLLTIKQFDDKQKKLKILTSENTELKEKYNKEKMYSLNLEADIKHMKDELISLQFSERTLRDERSRILSELSISRQRVREISQQMKEAKSFNKFISKHTPATNNSSNKSMLRDDDSVSDQMSYTSRYLEGSGKNYSENSQQFHQSFTDSNLSRHNHKNLNLSQSMAGGSGLTGVAGTSDAIYLREEEIEPLSITLERSLLSLHDTIAVTAPSLLPLVTKLGTELRNERVISHRQKVNLLSQLSSTNNNSRNNLSVTDSSMSSSKSPGKTPSRTTSKTPLKQNNYSNMSNSNNTIMKERNKSPSEIRGRTNLRSNVLYPNQNRSRSRSVGSVGDVSVSTNSSYNYTPSTPNSTSTSGRNKIAFFRRENDI